jgi:hypothetical protein
MDRAVFGQNATRRADGSIRESGSGHDPRVLAHRAKLEERATAAVAPEPEPRTLDLREVHNYHPTRQ